MKIFYVFELIIYFAAIAIIFYIDWRYGVATIMLVIADNMKTRRMMRETNKQTQDDNRTNA
jgi:membrane-anchored glycerophosphoryl diester phosphodiesterase (GDPDase)